MLPFILSFIIPAFTPVVEESSANGDIMFLPTFEK